MPLPEWRFDAIGTTWQVETPAPVTDDVRVEVARCIADFDRTWSRFRGDGAIAQLRTGEPVDLGPHAEALLGLYDDLYAATDGAVNPCVGNGLEQLGYDADYSLRPRGEARAAVAWTDARRDGSTLSLPPGTTLDVGAIGKGFLVDLVADVVGPPCVIDAGGDLVHRGSAPIRVALEHPKDPTMAVGVAELEPGLALCGSAVNRRAWGDGLHHVLDARTGRPTTSVVATWAIADSAARADAFATALFFLPPQDVDDDVHAVRVDASGRLQATPGFPGELFA